MAYQLIWEEKGTKVYFKGVVNDRELLEIVSKFYGHEQFDSIHYLLIDFLEVDTFDVTNTTFQYIGGMDLAAALSNPRVRVAIVTDNAAILDLLSSYENASQGSPWPSRYFDSIKEARAWIAT